MSASQLIFPEFRDEQRDSKYPFSDRSTLRAIDSNVTIDKSAFIDAAIYLIGGSGAAYISEIATTTSTIDISVKTTGNTAVSATGRLNQTSNQVSLYDRYGRPAGILLVRRENISFLYQKTATYAFRENALEFVATCFTPATEAGLSGIMINDTEFVSGNVLLVGHNGVTIRKMTDQSEDYSTTGDDPETHAKIRIDVVGNPLFRRIQCDKEGVSPATTKYIKTINGVKPNEFGHFIFTAIEDTLPEDQTTNNPVAIRIYPTAEDSLTIEAVSRSDV